jgi:hypothetical protein
MIQKQQNEKYREQTKIRKRLQHSFFSVRFHSIRFDSIRFDSSNTTYGLLFSCILSVSAPIAWFL